MTIRFLLISFLFIIFSPQTKAQKPNEFASIDKIALQIPDSSTRSTQSIARYIVANFSKDSDQSRAIFTWLTKNIQYDVENMFAINFYKNRQEIIDKAMKTRKGICQDYAELFNDIAMKAGLKSYVITGYTKQNGFVDFIPHAWCATLIDTSWYLFDPTWGSGYIQNAKFIKQVNNFYFKTKPSQLIKSHVPFDPLWQFLYYPVTNQEFYEGKTHINTSKPYFNFTDSLKTYESQSRTEQLVASGRRIEKNGVKNSLVFDQLQHTQREIEYLKNTRLVEQYNSAVNTYNEGINLLNRFIDYRNKEFTPTKPDAEIKGMLTVVEKNFESSKKTLAAIQTTDATTRNSIQQMDASISDATANLDEQKAFVEKYVSTKKIFRKTLFKQYSWMGIPLNKK